MFKLKLAKLGYIKLNMAKLGYLDWIGLNFTNFDKIKIFKKNLTKVNNLSKTWKNSVKFG
jgi:hypothetical protein